MCAGRVGQVADVGREMGMNFKESTDKINVQDSVDGWKEIEQQIKVSHTRELTTSHGF